MQHLMITCPFTGLPFEAIQYADGRIVATNALTGEDMQITYNASIKRYMLDSAFFHGEKMLTLQECADLLGISKARVSVLAKQDRLKAVKPSAQMYISLNSALQYKAYQSTLKEGAENGSGSC